VEVPQLPIAFVAEDFFAPDAARPRRRAASSHRDGTGSVARTGNAVTHR